jgi:heterodisulfide reductase subunit B
MIMNYYPGCTLKTKAKDLDKYARKCAQALGIELCEIPEWQCCGAVYVQGENEIASKLSSVRALKAAKENGGKLVAVCSACYNVIKRTNAKMAENGEFAAKANAYLNDGEDYNGETQVLHFLEMLRDEVGFDNIKKAVKNPLKGRKIGAYYGCLLLRPSNVLGFDNPENPTIIEDFIKALGATPVVYAYRNECCGGYVTMENKKLAQNRVELIMKNAKDQGAEELITACPLCLYNLKENATETVLPVSYITELLAQALGLTDEEAAQ